MRYSPLLPVTVSRVSPPASGVRVIFAPGIAASLVSVMDPASVPRVVCAAIDDGSASIRTTANVNILRAVCFMIFSLAWYAFPEADVRFAVLNAHGAPIGRRCGGDGQTGSIQG